MKTKEFSALVVIAPSFLTLKMEIGSTKQQRKW